MAETGGDNAVVGIHLLNRLQEHAVPENLGRAGILCYRGSYSGCKVGLGLLGTGSVEDRGLNIVVKVADGALLDGQRQILGNTAVLEGEGVIPGGVFDRDGQKSHCVIPIHIEHGRIANVRRRGELDFGGILDILSGNGGESAADIQLAVCQPELGGSGDIGGKGVMHLAVVITGGILIPLGIDLHVQHHGLVHGQGVDILIEIVVDHAAGNGIGKLYVEMVGRQREEHVQTALQRDGLRLGGKSGITFHVHTGGVLVHPCGGIGLYRNGFGESERRYYGIYVQADGIAALDEGGGILFRNGICLTHVVQVIRLSGFGGEVVLIFRLLLDAGHGYLEEVGTHQRIRERSHFGGILIHLQKEIDHLLPVRIVPGEREFITRQIRYHQRTDVAFGNGLIVGLVVRNNRHHGGDKNYQSAQQQDKFIFHRPIFLSLAQPTGVP